MKKNKFFILTILTITLIFVLFLTGCATDISTVKKANFANRPIAIAGIRQYEILGPVTLEKPWFGVIGFTIPFVNADMYIYQNGGFTYFDLLKEAKKHYSDTDAVIDISVEYINSRYFVFFADRKNLVTGIAIKYVKEPEGSIIVPNNNENERSRFSSIFSPK